MFLLKKSIKDKAIFKEPDPESRPPLWIRAILIMTCTLVSFFHGSNDGQKGVGMMLIVLLAFMPTQYALSPHFDLGKMTTQIKKMEDALIYESTINYELERTLCAKAERLNDFYNYLDALDLKNNKAVMNARKQMTILSKEMKIVLNTHHTPWWIIVLISISLGIGTMIGWKRIVVTIGEKIGKRHMTYAEGASAELIASSTIGLASGFGLPVSTTHVLSSGVAGAMVASKGIKNLQAGTIKNIALAWILTLPVTMVLSAVLFLIFRMFI
jgi:PiT family inorganic phosphate transporter